MFGKPVLAFFRNIWDGINPSYFPNLSGVHVNFVAMDISPYYLSSYALLFPAFFGLGVWSDTSDIDSKSSLRSRI